MRITSTHFFTTGATRSRSATLAARASPASPETSTAAVATEETSTTTPTPDRSSDHTSLPDTDVDSAGRKLCPKCGGRYNAKIWFMRHFVSCKGSLSLEGSEATASPNKDATSPGQMVDKRAECENCGVTFVASGREGELATKCRECQRRSFLEVSTRFVPELMSKVALP